MRELMEVERLDIRSEVCPMTYVRTKLKLEKLEVGALLEVSLRGDEPMRNIPRSARDEGHEVVSLVPAGEGEWTLVLRKRGGAGRGAL